MKKAFENNDVFSSDRFRRFLKPGGEEGDNGLGVGYKHSGYLGVTRANKSTFRAKKDRTTVRQRRSCR